MCSRLLLFCIASTQPDYCSDGRFEDFPGERATSQLPMETSFSAASTHFCYDYKIFGHVIKL
jgi:hypothetical protein